MQHINVGPGARYRYSGDFASDKDGFRDAFIEAFRNHVPGSVDSLNQIVPVYRQLVDLWEEFQQEELRPSVYARFSIDGKPVPLGLNRNLIRSAGRLRPSFHWRAVSHASETMYPDFLDLRGALIQWGKRWSMADADWFMDMALGTLGYWVTYPQMQALGAFIPGGSGDWAAATDEEAQFIFRDAGWIPNMERWADFEKRAKDRFSADLSDYHTRLSELAEGRGFRRVPSKHRPEHFVWLALYHCAGWKLDRIREQFGESVGSRQTIHAAVKATADLVGIELVKKR